MNYTHGEKNAGTSKHRFSSEKKSTVLYTLFYLNITTSYYLVSRRRQKQKKEIRTRDKSKKE